VSNVAISRAPTKAGETHPFTLKVEPLAGREGRYSWVIYRGEAPPQSSQESYATRREAMAAGDKVLVKLVGLWRVGK